MAPEWCRTFSYIVEILKPLGSIIDSDNKAACTNELSVRYLCVSVGIFHYLWNFNSRNEYLLVGNSLESLLYPAVLTNSRAANPSLRHLRSSEDAWDRIRTEWRRLCSLTPFAARTASPRVRILCTDLRLTL